MQAKVKEATGIQVSIKEVTRELKSRFRLSYRRIKRVVFQGNSERCLVLRHLYARKMLALLNESTHIVNIDETWVP